MGTKRTTAPAPAAHEPVEQHGLDAMLRLFVASFVIEDKRTQIRNRLLTAARRAETLATLPRWIAARTTPLEGADKSPAGLRARFGELVGIQLDEAGAVRTTIAHALERARSRASVFVADTGRVALVTTEGSPPFLATP